MLINNSIIANSTGGNCSSPDTLSGSSNLADDDSCSPLLSIFRNRTDIRLGPLGSYGGPTQTVPLLPGSYAIDKGYATCPTTDQRGVTRPQGTRCDIGAYESRGFSLAISAGDNQTALPGAAFTDPLEVTVTANASGEPVDGGLVTFSAPADGASATLTSSPAAISGGMASITAAANDVVGSYSVTANAAGAASLRFNLSNNLGDTTPPSITPNIVGTLGQDGWYTSDVSLTWSVVDNESTVSSKTGCDPLTISSDQAETTYTCSATSAGGTSDATASIKRDATAPVVTITGMADGNTYILSAVPEAGCSTTDAGSGVAAEATLSLSGGNSLGVGSFSAACSGAADNAGNSASPVSVKYNVTFQFDGFSAPVDNPSVLNIAKAGQTIPLKWRITDANGNPIGNLTGVTVTASSLSCSAGTTTDQIEEYATGNSGLQNLGDGYYQWNWKTPSSYAASCKTMKLDLGEGLFHTALFQFKK